MRRYLRAVRWGALAVLGVAATGAWAHRSQRDDGPAERAPAERVPAERGPADRAGRTLPVARSSLKVRLTHDAYAVLRCYVEAVDGEITLLGTAQVSPAGDEIVVEGFLLPEQSVSAAHTEVSEEALARLLVEAVQRDIDTSTLRVWLHSHADMGVFFSGTDEGSMDAAFPQADWVLSIVTNHAGDLKARLCLYRPFRVELDDLPVHVSLPLGLEAAIREEVAQKVSGQGRGRANGRAPGRKAQAPSPAAVEPAAGSGQQGAVPVGRVLQEAEPNGDRCYRVQF